MNTHTASTCSSVAASDSCNRLSCLDSGPFLDPKTHLPPLAGLPRKVANGIVAHLLSRSTGTLDLLAGVDPQTGRPVRASVEMEDNLDDQLRVRLFRVGEKGGWEEFPGGGSVDAPAAESGKRGLSGAAAQVVRFALREE